MNYNHLSQAAWATPFSLNERKMRGEEPAAEIHVSFPYGKKRRVVTVELDRAALLKVIANAADALRLLDGAS